jgi:diguanylate cyclase (GGDEF)-like protein
MAAGLFTLALAQWLFSEATGWHLPNYSLPEKHNLNQVIVLTATFLIVILSFFVYDRANLLLRQQRDQEREQLAELVNLDQLTGLANGRYMEQRLQQATARIDRHGGQLALLYLDFNGFKKINDDFGHRLGDILLAKMAERMREALRVEDVVARLGGDEFAVLIDNFSQQQDVEDVIARLHATIREHIEIEDKLFAVTASIGSVVYPRDVTQKHMIIELADRAMYRAKRMQHDHQSDLRPRFPADPPAALTA